VIKHLAVLEAAGITAVKAPGAPAQRFGVLFEPLRERPPLT
jgi:hypothetical protein